MSKEEAWGYLKDAWWYAHHEACVGNCNCSALLEQIKEVLYV